MSHDNITTSKVSEQLGPITARMWEAALHCINTRSEPVAMGHFQSLCDPLQIMLLIKHRMDSLDCCAGPKNDNTEDLPFDDEFGNDKLGCAWNGDSKDCESCQ